MEDLEIDEAVQGMQAKRDLISTLGLQARFIVQDDDSESVAVTKAIALCANVEVGWPWAKVCGHEELLPDQLEAHLDNACRTSLHLQRKMLAHFILEQAPENELAHVFMGWGIKSIQELADCAGEQGFWEAIFPKPEQGQVGFFPMAIPQWYKGIAFWRRAVENTKTVVPQKASPGGGGCL